MNKSSKTLLNTWRLHKLGIAGPQFLVHQIINYQHAPPVSLVMIFTKKLSFCGWHSPLELEFLSLA
jgi:hypothetical protein